MFELQGNSLFISSEFSDYKSKPLWNYNCKIKLKAQMHFKGSHT